MYIPLTDDNASFINSFQTKLCNVFPDRWLFNPDIVEPVFKSLIQFMEMTVKL